MTRAGALLRAWSALLAAGCCLVAGSVPAAAVPDGGTDADEARATWVWGRPDPEELTAFVTAQGVDDLFVWAPSDLGDSADLPWFVDLRDRTRAAGLRLHALGSEPSWLRHPAQAADWAADAVATGLFDGLHLDVEPWGRPDWDEHHDRLAGRYLVLLDRVGRASDLPVEADIAFWLGKIRLDEGRLDRLILDRVDAVTVMTYRNQVHGPHGIAALGKRSLTLGRRLAKPVRLAVETNYLGDDPVAQKQTFYGWTRAELAAELAEVDAAVARSPAYRGVSVHDSDGWAALAP